jgi:hypothetical protein
MKNQENAKFELQSMFYAFSCCKPQNLLKFYDLLRFMNARNETLPPRHLLEAFNP